MTSSLTSAALLYRWTAVFALAGASAYLGLGRVRDSLAFVLGACCSLGNLWLFDWLSRSIAPGSGTRKPWQAGAFVTRYILLLGIGYAIVKALSVSPLAVILGLFSSTAAVLVSVLIEIAGQVLKSHTRSE